MFANIFNRRFAVAIDLSSETPIPLRAAARHRLLRAKSRGGKALNFSTIWRWALHGVRGVKLETVRVGGTTCTTEQSIIRFIERLSDPGLRQDSSTPSDIQRDHVAAERRLAAAGV
jgi:hypothetical protein